MVGLAGFAGYAHLFFTVYKAPALCAIAFFINNKKLKLREAVLFSLTINFIKVTLNKSKFVTLRYPVYKLWDIFFPGSYIMKKIISVCLISFALFGLSACSSYPSWVPEWAQVGAHS